MSGKNALLPDLDAQLAAVLSDLHTFVSEQRALNASYTPAATEIHLSNYDKRWLDGVERAIFKFWDLKLFFVRR